MMNVWIWDQVELTCRQVHNAVALNTELNGVEDGAANAPRLVPITPQDTAIAAVIVPPGIRSLFCNGMRPGPGARLLRHTEQIDFAGLTFWVAAKRDVSVTRYAPSIHGADVFCFITKARLKTGDAIVPCPECSIIYRRAAWDLVVASDADFRCPNCRFNPNADEWKPQLAGSSSYVQFMERVRRRHSHPDMEERSLDNGGAEQ